MADRTEEVSSSVTKNPRRTKLLDTSHVFHARFGMFRPRMPDMQFPNAATLGHLQDRGIWGNHHQDAHQVVRGRKMLNIEDLLRRSFSWSIEPMLATIGQLAQAKELQTSSTCLVPAERGQQYLDPTSSTNDSMGHNSVQRFADSNCPFLRSFCSALSSDGRWPYSPPQAGPDGSFSNQTAPPSQKVL